MHAAVRAAHQGCRLLNTMKQVVVGVDAAWTPSGSSGFAVAELDGNNARLILAAPSYAAFGVGAEKQEVNWLKPKRIPLDVDAVLEMISDVSGQRPDLVAVDMPLSRQPISGRRTADNCISRAFGAAWAGTLSPSKERPGAYGRRLQTKLEEQGYVLQTKRCEARRKELIEVYPHTALIRLLNEPRRLTYKVAKRRKYWPELSVEQRTHHLEEVWTRIADGLNDVLPGSGQWISDARAHCTSMKAVEDVIDAIVSAWVGICFLRGAIEPPYGDDDAAIWVPCAMSMEEKTVGRKRNGS